MASKFREWWQKVKQHGVAIGVVGIGLVVAIALISFGYRLDWTGFNGNTKSGKTLWDWLQLLIIPVVLAIGGFWLNQIQKSREEKATELRTKIGREAAEKRAEIEREIAWDDQQEATLQEYINKMSELLLDRDLCKSTVKDEVRKVARVRTLTVLPRLNGKHKGIVLQFLYEAQLINKGDRIVDLTGANMTRADLSGLTGLIGPANLSNADLTEVYLTGANLLAVSLYGADLSGANLTKAKVTEEQLKEAKSLQGAIRRDGSIYS